MPPFADASRREFLRLYATCLGGAALAACGGGGEASPAPAAPAPSPPTAPAPTPSPVPTPAPAPEPPPVSGPAPSAGFNGELALALVGGGADKAWTCGQVFRPGDFPREVGAVAVTGTLASFQADVRNRWPDGSVKFAVLSGIGASEIKLVPAEQATSGAVALADLTASVTFSSVRNAAGAVLLAGPVTVTMPTSDSPAVFGADPASHVAGRVRRVDGATMTEYHCYAPVPGEAHLAVWWYVRCYANGAREIETLVECTPWVTVAGGGRRDYVVTVAVGGSVRLDTFAVQQFARTRWSRVDWQGTPPQVRPRHDTAYLRAFAFPYNNLGVPDADALNYGMGTAELAGNSFNVAMAPPINNPDSQLQWPSEIGATGTGGLLRTNVEAAYAAGADVYWSVEAHARSAGRYPVHVRDPETGRAWNIQAHPEIRNGAAFDGGYWIESSSRTAGWGTSHALPIGSGAYLLTGRYPYVEEVQQLANAQALGLNTTGTARDGYRLGGPYGPTSITPDVRAGAWIQWAYINQTAWSPETLGGRVVAGPDAMFSTALATRITAFVSGLRSAFQLGTTEAGIYKNTLGVVSWSPAYLNSYRAQPHHWGDNFMQTYICFVLDAAIDLHLPISPATQNDLVELHRFAMSRVVRQLGTFSGSGYNYRYWYQHMPVGARATNDQPQYPPPVWFEDYGEVWSATVEALNSGLVRLPDDVGEPLLNWTSNDGWVISSREPRSAVQMNSNELQFRSALALAVDRAVPGALDCWRRLQQSSTIANQDSQENYRNFPATHFTPRSLA